MLLWKMVLVSSRKGWHNLERFFLTLFWPCLRHFSTVFNPWAERTQNDPNETKDWPRRSIPEFQWISRQRLGLWWSYDLPGFGLWSTICHLWSTWFWLMIYFFFVEKGTLLSAERRVFAFLGAGRVLAYDLPICYLWSTYTLRSAERRVFNSFLWSAYLLFMIDLFLLSSFLFSFLLFFLLCFSSSYFYCSSFLSFPFSFFLSFSLFFCFLVKKKARK